MYFNIFIKENFISIHKVSYSICILFCSPQTLHKPQNYTDVIHAMLLSQQEHCNVTLQLSPITHYTTYEMQREKLE